MSKEREMRHEPGSIGEFSNRIRIIMGLEETAIPADLAGLNPIAASLWKSGGWGRVRAFIGGSDQVQDAIWNALLKYEQGKENHD